MSLFDHLVQASVIKVRTKVQEKGISMLAIELTKKLGDDNSKKVLDIIQSDILDSFIEPKTKEALSNASTLLEGLAYLGEDQAAKKLISGVMSTSDDELDSSETAVNLVSSAQCPECEHNFLVNTD